MKTEDVVVSFCICNSSSQTLTLTLTLTLIKHNCLKSAI